jgi:DNA-directed RNA polymerase specialized sigma24 family protein
MTVTKPAPQENSAAEGSDFSTFAELVARDPAVLTGDAYRQGLHLIQRYIRARFGGQQSQDIEDISSEVMIRLIKLAQTNQLDSARQPAAYLGNLIKWVALDYIKSQARGVRNNDLEATMQITDKALADDQVASVINQAATASIVRSAMAITRSRGDRTAFRVVTAFLDLAGQTGEKPTNRALASHLHLSHTGVANALDRFAEDLQKALLANKDI